MPRPTKGPRLGTGPSHQRLMLSGLAASLIKDERIQTTETKAKRLRGVVEKLVTLGKDGSIHSRRQALSLVEDRDVVHKLFDDIAPRFSDRSGGYVRILKLGPRKGDAAPMALIEFVEEGISTETTTEEPKKKGRRRRRRKSEETAVELPDDASEESEPAPEPQDSVETEESPESQDSDELQDSAEPQDSEDNGSDDAEDESEASPDPSAGTEDDPKE